MTSIDLRSRLVVSIRGWQFALADNRCDLNWLVVSATQVYRGSRSTTTDVRILRWELADAADSIEQLACLDRGEWRSRLLDSGLHLQFGRDADRGDVFAVGALVNTLDGPLPADLDVAWDGDRMVSDGLVVQGIRMRCSLAALGLFAAELRDELQAWPDRHLPKGRLHLGQPI